MNAIDRHGTTRHSPRHVGRWAIARGLLAALCVGYAIQTYRGREFRPLDALVAAAAGILAGLAVMRARTRRQDRTRADGTY